MRKHIRGEFFLLLAPGYRLRAHLVASPFFLPPSWCRSSLHLVFPFSQSRKNSSFSHPSAARRSLPFTRPIQPPNVRYIGTHAFNISRQRRRLALLRCATPSLWIYHPRLRVIRIRCRFNSSPMVTARRSRSPKTSCIRARSFMPMVFQPPAPISASRRAHCSGRLS